MPDRVVLLLEQPCTQREFDRFGLARMGAANLDVEVWEVQDIYAPRPRAESATRTDLARIRQYSREKDLTAAIASLTARDCIITTVGVYRGEESTMAPLSEALSASGAMLTALSSGHRVPMPTPVAGPGVDDVDGGQSVGRRMSAILSALRDNPRRIPTAARSFYRRRYRRPGRVRPLDAVWAGTHADDIQPRLITPSTHVEYIHTLDYDLVQRARVSPWTPQPRQAVYLDTMGPEHPDFAVHGTKLLTGPDEWFAAVRSAFDRLEAELGLAISIAPHPRAGRARLADTYGGRPILTVPTAVAILESELVIATSATTSLGIVACLERPCLLVRTPPIHGTHLAQLDAYGQALGLTQVEWDKIVETIAIPTVDERRYRDFVSAYVKRPGTAEGAFWDIVAARIQAWPG